MSYILVREAFLCTERSSFVKRMDGKPEEISLRSSFIATPVQSNPLAKLD
jgi:hypothetical protein